MTTRLQISGLVFMMVQAVLFGILVLATPMADRAMQLMPWVVASSFLVSIPVAWMLVPRLRARY